MSIKVRIPPILQDVTGGRDIVEVSASNFRECLDKLEVQFPGIKAQVYDKQGNVGCTFDIYVNEESAYPNELSKPLKDGDVISITMLCVGG